jgi:hypothetical protein
MKSAIEIQGEQSERELRVATERVLVHFYVPPPSWRFATQ